MKIPKSIIPVAYKTAKSVYNKEITLKQGTEILLDTESVNINSARDYLNNFKYILDGRKFTRTLNEESMEYYFKNITRDYGFDQLKISLQALNLHIEYYENLQNTTMHTMRAIHSRYSDLTKLPEFVTTLPEIQQNIQTLENGLTSEDHNQRLLYSKLIKKGICFIAYEVDKELRFAPSRFVGYKNNYAGMYESVQLDGRETNKRLAEILKAAPLRNESLENKFKIFCDSLRLEHTSAFNNKLKFWKLNLDANFNDNNLLSGEFPEGKLIERSHKTRERNVKVVQIAKANFKKLHGTLFCQVCNFNFEEKYGELGQDFIEGHHTIAVKDMPLDHKTKPEDIAMLCSNCHKMVHKRRPWLTMDKLTSLLNKK